MEYFWPTTTKSSDQTMLAFDSFQEHHERSICQQIIHVVHASKS